jgi:DNA-binding transcriptional MerR regulator
MGLLRPACVDPVSGYRLYQASQLAELNRVIALKELGFTLQQVQSILAEQVSAAELRGMLKLRRAEIQAVLEAETTRLARVEARLLTIEDEARAPADGVVIKRLEPVRVGELTGEAAGWEPEAITPVIQPLYGALWQRMASAEICAAGPAVAYYEDAPAGEGAIVVHAAVPVAAVPVAAVPVADVPGAGGSGGAGRDPGFAIVDLPAVERAAVIIHHGSMDDVMATGQALARWIDANGYRSAGYSREVTLAWSPDPEQWVTELQQPIHPTGD